MAKKEEINCSFCGRPKSEVDILIAGVTGHICENCIDQAHQIIDEEYNHTSNDSDQEFELLKPIEIKNKLDEYVIGQDDAKKYYLSQYIITTNGFQVNLKLMILRLKNRT